MILTVVCTREGFHSSGVLRSLCFSGAISMSKVPGRVSRTAVSILVPERFRFDEAHGDVTREEQSKLKCA